jgi:hypothetical protein
MKIYNIESTYPLHTQITQVVPLNPCKEENKQTIIYHYMSHNTNMNQSKIYEIEDKIEIRVLKYLGLFTFRNNYTLSTHQKSTSSLQLEEVKREFEQSQRSGEHKLTVPVERKEQEGRRRR